MYNCSSSYNWKAHISDAQIAVFQRELGKIGYRFQFVMAGFHSLNHGMFKLALEYRDNGMLAYTKLQEDEFVQAKNGFTAHTHQREVGAGYFDQISTVISGGTSSILAPKGSTEDLEEKFTQKTSHTMAKL